MTDFYKVLNGVRTRKSLNKDMNRALNGLQNPKYRIKIRPHGFCHSKIFSKRIDRPFFFYNACEVLQPRSSLKFRKDDSYETSFCSHFFGNDVTFVER